MGKIGHLKIRDVPVLSYRSIGTRIPAFFWYLVLDIGPAKFELNIRGYYQNICSIGVSAVSGYLQYRRIFWFSNYFVRILKDF